MTGLDRWRADVELPQVILENCRSGPR
jgi:hypothetical protein